MKINAVAFSAIALLSRHVDAVTMVQDRTTIGGFSTATVTVRCPGTRVLGGGVEVLPPSAGPKSDQVVMLESYPADEHSWRVRIRSDDSASYGVVAYAMCN